jgi:hypothetical protein
MIRSLLLGRKMSIISSHTHKLCGVNLHMVQVNSDCNCNAWYLSQYAASGWTEAFFMSLSDDNVPSSAYTAAA